MPGLLSKGGFDDPLTMGLLGASQALMTPMSQGGGMGAAFNVFPAAQQQAMRQQFLRQQMEGQQSEAELRRAQLMAAQEKARRDAEQLAARQGILGGISAPQQMGFRDANIAITGVAPAGYQPPEQRNPITQDVVAQWVAAGGDPDVLKKLAESGDWGRAEVARVLETADPQGRPGWQQMDKFGRSVGSVFAKPYEKKMVNTGGAQVGYDPYTLGLTGQSIANTMTPGDVQQSKDAAAGRGLTIRGQNLAEAARLAEANRPIWSPEQGAFVYRPTTAAPTGSFVQPVGPGGVPFPPKAADIAKIETDLRKELNDLPQVKKFANATPAYKAIVDAAGRDNKQADINLVYGLAKLYDPDSVVREGEYDTIAKSQTIPEWLKGQAASLMGSGGKLTAQTRALILKEAESRLNSYRTEYDSAANLYAGIARQRGVNPQNIVVPIAGDIPKSGNWSITKMPVK